MHKEAPAYAVPLNERIAPALTHYMALAAAWIATSGSLFMSEVLEWIPCLLCWYQRILMYPLAIIFTVGLLRRDRSIHLYVLPFSIPGIGVALYHYLLIKTDWLPPPDCSVGVPCNVDYIDWFGFINIPLLALTAFLIITVSMLFWMSFAAEEAELPGEAGWAPSRTSTLAIIGGVLMSFALLGIVI